MERNTSKKTSRLQHTSNYKIISPITLEPKEYAKFKADSSKSLRVIRYKVIALITTIVSMVTISYNLNNKYNYITAEETGIQHTTGLGVIEERLQYILINVSEGEVLRLYITIAGISLIIGLIIGVLLLLICNKIIEPRLYKKVYDRNLKYKQKQPH